MTNFEQVTHEILDRMSDWNAEAHKHVRKGNKAAGQRARVISIELEKLMKQWRALSTGREPVTE
jgi:hypothetical protein